MEKMEKMAIQAAYGFGGSAEPSHLKVIEKLQKMGLVGEIDKQRMPMGDIYYYYSLTKKGKEQAKALRNQ